MINNAADCKSLVMIAKQSQIFRWRNVFVRSYYRLDITIVDWTWFYYNGIHSKTRSVNMFTSCSSCYSSWWLALLTKRKTVVEFIKCPCFTLNFFGSFLCWQEKLWQRKPQSWKLTL